MEELYEIMKHIKDETGYPLVKMTIDGFDVLTIELIWDVQMSLPHFFSTSYHPMEMDVQEKHNFIDALIYQAQQFNANRLSDDGPEPKELP